VDLGRSAYQQLSDRLEHSAAAMYHQLADAFVSLMDILQTMRTLGDRSSTLTPLNALELWRDTGSEAARRALRETTLATPLLIPIDDDHRH